MLLQRLIMTEGSPQKGSLVGGLYQPTNAKGHRTSLRGNGRKWVKCVDRTFLSWSPFPDPFDHLIIAWEIRTPNRICQIINFQGTCDPCCSVSFSRSVVSDSLRRHGLRHARPPCSSPTPRVYPNSCPLSQ